jgi:hypothetical protein
MLKNEKAIIIAILHAGACDHKEPQVRYIAFESFFIDFEQIMNLLHQQHFRSGQCRMLFAYPSYNFIYYKPCPNLGNQITR